jgi:hypothetical protein
MGGTVEAAALCLVSHHAVFCRVRDPFPHSSCWATHLGQKHFREETVGFLQKTSFFIPVPNLETVKNNEVNITHGRKTMTAGRLKVCAGRAQEYVCFTLLLCIELV